MGLLKHLGKARAIVRKLPSGTLTVDRQGNVISATVSSAYSPVLLREIAGEVLALFREARVAQMPLTQLSVHFASLHLTAREMRGGAIIFLSSATPHIAPSTSSPT